MNTWPELGGTVDQLETQCAARIEEFSGKTLGTFVKTLFESYVVAPGPDDTSPDEANVPADKVSMRFRFRMEMDEERRSAVNAASDDLVQSHGRPRGRPRWSGALREWRAESPGSTSCKRTQ
jgi:hypothetical protein